MIFWYSGTGNTRYAASVISRATSDEASFIPSLLGLCAPRALPATPSIDSHKQCIGIFSPVYSWGIPPIVIRWIAESEVFNNADGKYIYAVLTCGDETGRAPQMLLKALSKRGVKADAVWSVIMPNDYVMLTGFSVDSPRLARTKLDKALPKLREISEAILNRESCFDCFEGPMARLKTAVVYPLFKRWGTSYARWNADENKCIGCGACAAICPASNIAMTARRGETVRKIPVWKDNCLSCTACFHICPERAIDFGRFTKGKPQYFCPNND